MAHLQYNTKEKGVYLNTRRDLDLGWTFFDEGGKIIKKTERLDLTIYERVLLSYRKRMSKLSEQQRRPRKRLSDVTKRKRGKNVRTR